MLCPSARSFIFQAGQRGVGQGRRGSSKRIRRHVKTVRSMIVYSARRLRLARDGHARDQMLIAAAQAAKRSNRRGRHWRCA